jgi:hypothetical protein
MENSMEKGTQGLNPTIFSIVSIIILLALTVALFADVLFSEKEIVISIPNADLANQFAYWREFGFNQLRQGVFALWNPHVFSGLPFFGGFQSALLYPFNLLYLILPLPAAINWSVALHVFLIGTFMYLWTWHRGLHPLACLVSSVLLMFCGAHFMHIQAGHLPHLCTMTWAPLLFLSIDGFFQKRSLGWCLLGTLAIAMQILAGYPQHVFYTAIAGIIYAGLCIAKAQKRTQIAVGFLSMYAGAIALGAVQLLTGMQVALESIRSGGLSYEFAASHSFPPENLVTFLAPSFFGDYKTLLYWGRWYLWEASLFVGLTGLFLAIYGAAKGKGNKRRFSLAMASLLLLLALGGYTPLFKILHAWVPGFDKFRGSSKFIFQASLFIAMLAGIGLDHMVRFGRVHRRTILMILALGFLLGAVSGYMRHSAGLPNTATWWNEAMYHLYATGESWVPEKHYIDPQFVNKACLLASKSLMIPAVLSLVIAILLFASRMSQKAIYVIALIAIIEIFVFARTSVSSFPIASIQVPQIKQVLDAHPGDYRIFNRANCNSAMSTGGQDIWGYDSIVLKRYAEFMTFTQGYSPEEATQNVGFAKWHKLYKMLRCRFSFIPEGNKITIYEAEHVLPRLQLIQNYIILRDRDQIFRMMADDSFDPRQKVILESLPDPQPVISEERGTATVVDSSTDYLIIEADIPHPSILLITDAYSRGWRARALPGSSQTEYRVMPANYVLRAIPLFAGHHRIRVEYLPLPFQIGKWVSVMALVIYTILTGWHIRRRRGNVAINPRCATSHQDSESITH